MIEAARPLSGLLADFEAQMRRRAVDHFDAATRSYQGGNVEYARVLASRGYDFQKFADKTQQQARVGE